MVQRGGGVAVPRGPAAGQSGAGDGRGDRHWVCHHPRPRPPRGSCRYRRYAFPIPPPPNTLSSIALVPAGRRADKLEEAVNQLKADGVPGAYWLLLARSN